MPTPEERRQGVPGDKKERRQVVEMDILADPERLRRLDLSAIEG